ncbi:putative hydro-lyase [Halomonas sp. GDM18]|nr:putative hydro-lyase [Halomonas sp. GDM18]
MPQTLLSAASSPREAREQIRSGHWASHTSGIAAGYAQTNLIILPAEAAGEFLQFCQANPKACPLLDVTAVGSPAPTGLGENIDLRHDLPAYHIYRHGKLEETREDIAALWQDDFVAFSIGCSFSFEEALLNEGVEVRHARLKRNVPMYRTNIPLISAGRFHGNLVVSLRPMSAAHAIRAIQITTDMPRVHGAPVHLGDPALIGIPDIESPDFGDAPTLETGDMPVFWACGVTPQLALENARLPLAIAHSPGHMLITDIPNHRLKYG